jgi:heme-degrading monooxygenase HmoA
MDAKPTDMSTVSTAMKKCLDMSNYAGQEHAIQAFDQQLYAISQQVKWSRPGIFDFGLVKDKASMSEAVVPSVYDVLHIPLVRPQI